MVGEVTVEEATYVADTHSLYWHFKYPDRLSAAADAVFRLAETGNAIIVIPAIVVAELYFLTVKQRQPFTPSELFTLLEQREGVYLSDLGRVQLENLALIDDIPEMHDRLIAAEAMALNAPIVTRDGIMSRSQHIRTIW
jgi:PIN domain nuclease of toxin-antitoxin system